MYFGGTSFVLGVAGIWIAVTTGCERLQVSQAKQEARAKFLPVLQMVPTPEVLELAEPTARPELHDVRLGDYVVRVPLRPNEISPLRMPEQCHLKYDGYWVLLTLTKPGEADLPADWGATNFDRFRAVYRLDESEIDKADTIADQARLRIGIAMKTLLITNFAKKRFQEFHSPRWRGFVFGIGDVGDGNAVEFQCHGVTEKSSTPHFHATFFNFAAPPDDAELQRYVAAIELQSAATGSAEPPADDIAFQAKVDGSEQRYLQRLPRDFDPRQTHDLLIGLHGHGSDRRQFMTHPRDECRAARDFAAEHRMIFITPDYRAPTSWMGPKAEADLVQIIEETKARQRIGRVIVSGESMGGTGALTFAVLHPELVDGVMAMNGTANLVEFENFQEAMRESFGGDKTQMPDEYKRRSAELRPERLTMPIACTTGGQDKSVPPQSVQRLMAELKRRQAKALLIHRPDGGHSTNHADAMEAYEFVFRNLRPADK